MATKKKSAAAKKKPAAAKKAAPAKKVKMTTTEAIKAGNKVLLRHLATGNAAGIAACYTKKAILMPSAAPAQKGAKKIAGFWADEGIAESISRPARIRHWASGANRIPALIAQRMARLQSQTSPGPARGAVACRRIVMPIPRSA